MKNAFFILFQISRSIKSVLLIIKKFLYEWGLFLAVITCFIALLVLFILSSHWKTDDECNIAHAMNEGSARFIMIDTISQTDDSLTIRYMFDITKEK